MQSHDRENDSKKAYIASIHPTSLSSRKLNKKKKKDKNIMCVYVSRNSYTNLMATKTINDDDDDGTQKQKKS